MNLNADVTHLLAGSTLMVSFVLLYQTRMYGILNAFAMQALLLALAVAWQARVQHAPHLMVTAFMALVVKAGVIPWVLRIIIRRLGIQRNIESVVGVGSTLLVAVFLTMLAVLIVVPMTSAHAEATRQDLA
ncbi:MAG: hydrogenase-4 component E, partial [Magnetococcales bacterium]|nr:hydrogenase-4 component E [Magnetococcales bacterium]